MYMIGNPASGMPRRTTWTRLLPWLKRTSKSYLLPVQQAASIKCVQSVCRQVKIQANSLSGSLFEEDRGRISGSCDTINTVAQDTSGGCQQSIGMLSVMNV